MVSSPIHLTEEESAYIAPARSAVFMVNLVSPLQDKIEDPCRYAAPPAELAELLIKTVLPPQEMPDDPSAMIEPPLYNA